MNHREYFQDKNIFGLFVASIVFAVIGVLNIVLRVSSSEVLVPIRYLANGDIQRANWLNLYLLAAFFVLTCVGHIILSMRLYHVRRGYAYALLISYLMLAVIGLRVSSSVINLFY